MTNKSALVIGASGMVGTALMKVLGRSKTYFKIKGVDIETDMTIKSNTEIIKDYDHIYHLAGKKGSPQTAKERPADYLPMLQFDANIIEAVGKYKPEWFLYTSSIGVYPPMEVYEEDKVWHEVPSENDKIPGYIKRMGELGCYAIRATYGYENISIVRPANIYGPNDNFGKNSMVIPALIKKGHEDDVINVWGDGSPTRDFIYIDDVVKANIMAVNAFIGVYDVGTGVSSSFEELVVGMGIKPVKLFYTTEDKIPSWYQFYTKADRNKWLPGWYPEYDIERGTNKYKNYLNKKNDRY